ncbi:MAG: polyisoprenoid-binding protein [Betaproteobacteria bacterium]|nr:polyisoprenoid-binding protein [Betaproteobacteria bacterium]
MSDDSRPRDREGAFERRAPMSAAVLLAAMAMPAWSAPEDFVVDPGHTYPSFEVSHLGISTLRGRFEHTTGSIALDRDAGTGSIDVTIDVSALSTGNKLLDAMLKGEDFFSAEHFPAMTYRSRSIVFEAGVPKRTTGDFTLLGVKRPVVLDIVRFGCTRLPFFVRLTCGADVVATVNRSDFGMTAYSSFVGDEVKIAIQIEAVKQEPAAEPAPAGG